MAVGEWLCGRPRIERLGNAAEDSSIGLGT